jgi:hypothetical protein
MTMTASEHYEKAMELRASVDDWDVTNPEHQPIIADLRADAQFHATMAVATFQREHLSHVIAGERSS